MEWNTSPHLPGMGHITQFSRMVHITTLSRDGAHYPIYQVCDTSLHFPRMGHITQLYRDGTITTLSRDGKLNLTVQGWDTSPQFSEILHITSLSRDEAHHRIFQEWDTTPHFPWMGNITLPHLPGIGYINPTFQGWNTTTHFPGMGNNLPRFPRRRNITTLSRDMPHCNTFQG